MTRLTDERLGRNFIRAENLIKAENILYKISIHQPDEQYVRPKLQILAKLLLCVQWHQNQATDTVDQWIEKMQEEYPLGFVDASGGVPLARTSSDTDSVLSVPSPMAVSSSPSQNSPSISISQGSRSAVLEDSLRSHFEQVQSDTETLQETLRALREAVRRVEFRLVELDGVSPPSPNRSTPAPSRVSTSDISSLHLSRVSTTRSSSTNQLSRAGPRRDRVSVATPSRTCTRTHVRRRDPDDACAICMDSIGASDQLVWCRSSCGRSVHKLCFEAWEAECVENGRTATCVHCRAAWSPDCGCEE